MPNGAQSCCRDLTAAQLVCIGGVALAYVAAVCAVSAWFAVVDLAAVRNLCGFLALLFAAQACIGFTHAPMVPVVYLFVSTLFGRAHSGEWYFWAWALTPANWLGVCIAVGALCVSVVVCLVKPPRRDITPQFYFWSK